tara:strand:- start:985 stop:1989 length:1005 start_codon:yes stop_codon:yes gene_type:complete
LEIIVDETNQNAEEVEAPLGATQSFAENQGDLAVDNETQSLDSVQSDAPPSFDDSPTGDVEPSFKTEDNESHASFSALDLALSDIEELEHDGFYNKIDESHLKDLPPVARRILHNFRVDRKLQEKSHNTEMQNLMAKIEARERRLAQSERDFSKQQSEFASLVENPEVQAILQEPSGELPDVFTQEGIEARIQQGIAKGMQTVLQPMKAAADIKSRENSYLDFLTTHPEMKDSGFKKEVAGLVRTRADAGTPVSTQDAYQLVKARRVMSQQQARVQQEQRARQQSARRVGRAVSGGNPSNGEIPSDVKKQGAFAIASWLKANPEAARKLSQSLR